MLTQFQINCRPICSWHKQFLLWCVDSVIVCIQLKYCHKHREAFKCCHLVTKSGTVNTFTFMHLADAFIQSDLQCTQAIHFLHYVCSLGIEPTTFCAANTMLYHWATGRLIKKMPWSPQNYCNYTAIWVACMVAERAQRTANRKTPAN